MFDLLRKNLLLGIGLASMTQSKLKEIGKKLAEEGKLSREDGEKFVEDLIKQADETKSNVEKQISSVMEKTMGKMKLPCTEGFDRMEKELKELRAAVGKLQKRTKKITKTKKKK